MLTDAEMAELAELETIIAFMTREERQMTLARWRKLIREEAPKPLDSPPNSP